MALAEVAEQRDMVQREREEDRHSIPSKDIVIYPLIIGSLPSYYITSLFADC